MSIAEHEKEFVRYVVELMQIIGPVKAKAMFGGYGIYLEGLMFGLVAGGVLYLKTDNATESEFQDRGLEAFKYYKKGKEYKMSYYQSQEDALEDVEEMCIWTNKAIEVALKAAAKKR